MYSKIRDAGSCKDFSAHASPSFMGDPPLDPSRLDPCPHSPVETEKRHCVVPLPASANKYCLCWAAESTTKQNSFSYEHTFLVDHFPSSAFLSMRGRRCSLSATASYAVLRPDIIGPLRLLRCCSSCGFNVDATGSHSSSETLEILEIICNFLICH